MKPAKHSVFIEGETIDLRPLALSDIEGPYVEWFNDAEVCRFNSHHVYPYNKELAAQYVASAAAQKEALILAIVTKDGMHIGNVSLQGIDYVSRNAEFAIVIGDKNYWGKGVGKEAGRLVLEHGFKVLNLHRIWCGTSERNIAMQKLAATLGMREEGRRRQALYKGGEYVDIIEYGILKDEYTA